MPSPSRSAPIGARFDEFSKAFEDTVKAQREVASVLKDKFHPKSPRRHRRGERDEQEAL
ncbi:MAG: hypothetical protein QM783_04815 [Phycisphaerales bacterium]